MPLLTPFGGRRASITPGGYDLMGSFAPAGVGAPSDIKGRMFTVARTDVGEFQVTLKQRIPDHHAIIVSAQCATAGLFAVEAGAITGTTLVLRTVDVGGAPVDVAADPSNRVHFSIAVGGN